MIREYKGFYRNVEEYMARWWALELVMVKEWVMERGWG